MTDWNKKYLLSIDELLTKNSESVTKEAFQKVGRQRRQKAERCRQQAAQAACLGAGLLLQLTAAAYEEGLLSEDNNLSFDKASIMRTQKAEQQLCRFSVTELLTYLKEPRELALKYGENGKPYFKELPLYFNLSHSGRYVLCAVSNREIGADIQQIREIKELQLAERHFAKEEYRQLELCEDLDKRRQLFFQLWSRKEAYGKLTGKGLSGCLEQELFSRESQEKLHIFWEEQVLSEGYCMAVCQCREKEKAICGADRTWRKQ